MAEASRAAVLGFQMGVLHLHRMEGEDEESTEVGKTAAGVLAAAERNTGPEGATGYRAAAVGVVGAAAAAVVEARVARAAVGVRGNLAG